MKNLDWRGLAVFFVGWAVVIALGLAGHYGCIKKSPPGPPTPNPWYGPND